MENHGESDHFFCPPFFLRILFSFFGPVHPTLPQAVFLHPLVCCTSGFCTGREVSTFHVTRKGVEVLGDSERERESDQWTSWTEGITRNGQDVLVGLSELNLTADGYLPRIETQEAVADLLPFQVPPNAVDTTFGVHIFPKVGGAPQEGGPNCLAPLDCDSIYHCYSV